MPIDDYRDGHDAVARREAELAETRARIAGLEATIADQNRLIADLARTNTDLARQHAEAVRRVIISERDRRPIEGDNVKASPWDPAYRRVPRQVEVPKRKSEADVEAEFKGERQAQAPSVG